jgi:hypothetical protein
MPTGSRFDAGFNNQAETLVLTIAKYVKQLRPLRLLTACSLCLFALGCSPERPTGIQPPAPNIAPDTRSSFTMGNKEIRQDILNALTKQGIEHWINADGSVGFYAVDTEAVDAIGFNAIGAYAARN